MIHAKPIIFVAGGTRGDVQPFIVLAKAMQDQHIHVCIAASKRWQAVITQHQIPFVEIPPDPVELLLQPRFQHALTPTPRGLLSTVDYLNEMRPYVYALERAIPALLHHASAIIATVASQWVSRPYVWDSLPIVWGLFQPVVPTAAFATPLIEHTIHPALNQFSHQCMNHAMWFSWGMHTAQFRGGLMNISQQSAFVACSRELLPDWHDIQSQHAVTGWLGPLPNASALPEEIRAFINHDAPFAVATFGTPAANESADMYDAVIKATQRCGLRLVLHVPDRFAALNVPDGVVVLSQDVNHAELFARAHIVLHHGGAGTTHACVAAGVPMVVIPRGIDQYFWAQRMCALGFLPSYLPRQSISTDAVEMLIVQTLASTQIRDRVQRSMRNLVSEHSVYNAVSFIQRAIANHR